MTKVEALALLADTPPGNISAADLRAIIDAIFTDGVENIPALTLRIDSNDERLNDLTDDSPEVWSASGTFSDGDVVHHNGVTWVTRGDPAGAEPGVGATWVSLTLESLEARIATLEAAP